MNTIQFTDGAGEAEQWDESLPYRVTAVDPRTGQRRTYGRASERTGADSLAGSCKVQSFKVGEEWKGYRDVKIERKAAAQLDLLDGRGGWVEVP